MEPTYDELRRENEALRRENDVLRCENQLLSRRVADLEAQVERLRAEHGVYMVGDSRINVAGLPEDGMDKLAKAIVSVLD